MPEIHINQIDLKHKYFYGLFSSKDIYNKDKLNELGMRQLKVGARS